MMNDMEYEDYVTYRLAVELKHSGFHWPCRYYYQGEHKYEGCKGPNDYNNPYVFPNFYSAPTIETVAKWLREVKGFFIDVWLCAAGWSWNIEKCFTPENMGTFVTKHDEESGDDPNSGLFTSYEKALEDGIIHALNLKPTEYE